MCGGPGMDMKVSSTIGYERDSNPDAARSPTRTSSSSRRWPSSARSRRTSRRSSSSTPGPLLTDGRRAAAARRRARSSSKRAAGALIVDVRTDLQFDEAHIPGSVCIPMHNAGFGSKLAWIADHEHDIVLVGRDDDDGRHAGQLAVAVGMRRLAGFLARRDDELAPGAPPDRTSPSASTLATFPVAMRGQTTSCRSSTSATSRSGTTGHLPGSTLKTWHDITALPDGPRSRQADRRRLRLRPARRDRREPGPPLRRRQGAARRRRRRAEAWPPRRQLRRAQAAMPPPEQHVTRRAREVRRTAARSAARRCAAPIEG